MGTLFNKLENKEELSDWICANAGFEDTQFCNHTASLEYLMRFWDRNKENLFHLLGNNIIVENNISYEKSETQLYNDMHDLLCKNESRNFRRAYLNWLDNWYWDMTSANTYAPEILNNITENLKTLVSTQVLVENRYDGPSFKIKVGEITIPLSHGCKVMKVLGKIATIANLRNWENFRIAHSVVFNQRVVSGTLCLSIHPLDYFTMSDNEYGWDSCMNWRNRGCYRLGTVEMCNSPYVVVAYLKGDKEMRFYDNVWNSKKWRNLFIVNEDIITGIKGYPYQSEQLDTACIKILKSLAKENLGWEYEETIHEYTFENNYEDVDVTPTFTCSMRFETGCMYNDFGNNNITHFVLNPTAEDIDICYSGETECMCCGQTSSTIDFEDGEYVICNDCCSYEYCQECDSRIRRNDDAYELDGMTLCESCYYDNRIIDAITDEEHHVRNCIEVYLIEDEEEETFESTSYSDFVQNHKSIYVYNDAAEYKGYFEHPHYASLTDKDRWAWWNTDIRYVCKKECTEDGLAIFRYNGR